MVQSKYERKRREDLVDQCRVRCSAATVRLSGASQYGSTNAVYSNNPAASSSTETDKLQKLVEKQRQAIQTHDTSAGEITTRVANIKQMASRMDVEVNEQVALLSKLDLETGMASDRVAVANRDALALKNRGSFYGIRNFCMLTAIGVALVVITGYLLLHN